MTTKTLERPVESVTAHVTPAPIVLDYFDLGWGTVRSNYFDISARDLKVGDLASVKSINVPPPCGTIPNRTFNFTGLGDEGYVFENANPADPYGVAGLIVTA